MPSKEYWKRRQVMDAYKVFQDAEKVSDEIAKLYKKSSSYISKKIEGIFERFKVKWGLSDQEAWNLIAPMRSSAELDDLLQKLQNTTQTDRIRELRAQIESSAYRARIERLAELVDQMDAVMHRVYRQELKQSSDFYRGLARDAYYRSIFNLQQRANASFSFAHIDHKAIDKVLSMNWSGQHYSKRIWNNTKDLAQTVKQELMVSLITGKTEREAANVIATRFAQGASRARRLVRTESNHVSTELNSMAYEEAGVEEYLYLATLDLRTSEICRSLDGKIFKLAERKVGTNCPPMHPWCRSTTIAVIDRELLKNLTRRARDPETGKTYTVPLTMNYEQWYKKYVEGKPKAEANEKRVKNKSADRKQHEEYRKILGKDAPETLDKFQEMKYNEPDEWGYLKGLKAYLDKYPSSDKRYYDAWQKIKALKIMNGVLLPPIKKQAFILPEGTKDPYHIMYRMLERNITDDDVRSYMENAKAMFVQWGGQRQLFVSSEGMALITRKDDEWIYKTAWSKNDYDENSEKILEVLDNAGL